MNLGHRLNLGLKLFASNLESLPAAIDLYQRGVYQFLEVKTSANAGEKDLRFIQRLSSIPLAIHYNEVNFQHLIHDGERLYIENSPPYDLSGLKCSLCSPKELERYIRYNKCGFCLDFAHAICWAHAEGIDPMYAIDEFMGLKPARFHLCDGHMSSGEDEHLNLGMGDYPLVTFTRIAGDAPVLIETRKSDYVTLDEFVGDVEFLLSLDRSDDGIARLEGMKSTLRD